MADYHSTNFIDHLRRAQTLDDAMDAANAELSINRTSKYDDTLPDDDNSININPYLTDKEHDDAIKWRQYLDHEVILLHGGLGQGKGAIGNFTIKKANYYYDKKVILDYRPRVHFDLQFMAQFYDLQNHNPHNPLLLKQTDYLFFDKATYVEQLSRMGDASLGELANEADPNLKTMEQKKAAQVSHLTGAWMSQYGMVHMQRAIMGLDEIKKYHFKMRQNDPFGIQLIYMYDVLRHMHLCILGMTAYYEDLDPNRYLPKVTVEIKCHKSEYNRHTVMGEMYKVNWIDAKKTRQFQKTNIPIKLDVIEPWALLGGTILELTQAGKETLPQIIKDDTKDEILRRLCELMSAINEIGRASLYNLPYKLGWKMIDIMNLVTTYSYLIKLDYAQTELLKDVDKGDLIQSGSILVRKTDIILVKDTTGFRDDGGVAWLESEYIGYALRTDNDGWSYKDGERKENLGIPNALLGVYRRMNWRINHCEPAEHKIGSAIFTGLGVGDIYNSWNAIGLPVAKSMKR
jgi:hypothetical protein